MHGERLMDFRKTNVTEKDPCATKEESVIWADFIHVMSEYIFYVIILYLLHITFIWPVFSEGFCSIFVRKVVAKISVLAPREKKDSSGGARRAYKRE